MAEPKLIAEFKKCNNCGSEETVSELACAPLKESGKLPKEAFTSLKKEIIPIEQPTLAGVTVSCIVTSFDVCAICGEQRCTRSEIMQMPVTGQPPAGGPRYMPRNNHSSFS